MGTETRIAPRKRVRRREYSAPDGAEPRTSVIIPAYNEEEGLPIVLGKLLPLIDETYEVIVVDDGSNDRTRDVAAAFPCRILSHASNRGKGQAMKTGIEAARGENVILIDADDTYPVELIPRMASELDNCEMVVGSRKGGKEQIPAFNRIGNAIFRGSIRHLYGFKAYDPLTGLYGIKKAQLSKMRLDSDGFGVEAEIAIKAARMGLRTVDIPIGYRPRVGQAKLRGLQDGYHIFHTILKMLSLYNPSLAFVVPGALAFAIGAILMAALLAQPITVGGEAPGIHIFVLAGMLSLAGLQLCILGFALSLYASTHRFTKPDSLTTFLVRQGMSQSAAALGIVLLGVGAGLSVFLGVDWLRGGSGSFEETKALALAAFLGIVGLELTLSSVFLSIFVSELSRTQGAHEAEP